MKRERAKKGRPSKIKPIRLRIPRTFIDLFAGCGGLTLGLFKSGWRGVFGIEKDPWAFETLKHNLMSAGKPFRYRWPRWLSKEALNIRTVLRKYKTKLKSLRGRVGLVAGAPPCQGFSFAGLRRKEDGRNQLFKAYVRFVELVRPALVLVENVQAITIEHGRQKRERSLGGRRPVPYSERLIRALSSVGYAMQPPALLHASKYGIPQLRPRFVAFGVRRDLLAKGVKVPSLGELMDEHRGEFLRSKGLPTRRPVSVGQAISDLLRKPGRDIECRDPDSPPGFKSGLRSASRTNYQLLMHAGCNGEPPDSHRFVNHSEPIVERFTMILASCRPGIQLTPDDRKRFKIKKKALAPLAKDKPSHTLTSLPDDLIHYSQARVLTVREYARLQSFPDWFEFKGKYTTGGQNRRKVCPRYTQIGNAVPVLLAELLGQCLIPVRSSLLRRRRGPNA